MLTELGADVVEQASHSLDLPIYRVWRRLLATPPLNRAEIRGDCFLL